MKARDTNCEIEGFILAGGVSSRMRCTKSLLEFEGVPLIKIAVTLVEPLVSVVSVVGPPEVYAPLGLRAIADDDFGVSVDPGRSKGPLVGIVTALEHVRKPWSLTLACDLPYLNREWLDWLITRAMHSKAQVVLPRTARGLEPLAAMYRAECAEPLLRELRRGVRKVVDALAALRVEVVTDHEWKEFDVDGSVLENMNDLQDYDLAKSWWNSKRFGEDAASDLGACPGEKDR